MTKRWWFYVLCLCFLGAQTSFAEVAKKEKKQAASVTKNKLKKVASKKKAKKKTSKKKKKARVISDWLQVGPGALYLPAFGKEKGGKFGVK